jgi:hypothetical protein
MKSGGQNFKPAKIPANTAPDQRELYRNIQSAQSEVKQPGALRTETIGKIATDSVVLKHIPLERRVRVLGLHMIISNVRLSSR